MIFYTIGLISLEKYKYAIYQGKYYSYPFVFDRLLCQVEERDANDNDTKRVTDNNNNSPYNSTIVFHN